MAPITEPCKLIYFETKNGKCPFSEWMDKLESSTRVIINTRLSRVKLGNWGDCEQLKGATGLWELRIHHGPGYRFYLGKVKNTFFVLLCAGLKKDQTKDIQLAKKYWADYKEMK
jgi:putative addiction module killer protein